MFLYFIIAVIFAIASAVLFEFFGPEVKEMDDYIGLCGLAVLCSILWPLELIIGLVVVAGLWARSIKKQLEEKRRKNGNER